MRRIAPWNCEKTPNPLWGDNLLAMKAARREVLDNLSSIQGALLKMNRAI